MSNAKDPICGECNDPRSSHEGGYCSCDKPRRFVPTPSIYVLRDWLQEHEPKLYGELIEKWQVWAGHRKESK